MSALTEMDSQTKILYGIIAAASLVVLAIFLQPALEEQLAPEIRGAWVGIEVGGSGVAEIGPVEIEAGTPFRLHAVVEAEGRGRRPVYYTEAAALAIAGEKVAPEHLRRWDRPLEPRIRWFTVEGSPPYVELASNADLDRFGFQELYRPDWPLTWSVPGVLEPAKDDHLQDDSQDRRGLFGTQRYHVLVELYNKLDKMRPQQTVRSMRAADLTAAPDRFPTVRQVLPGRLAPVSGVFGLTQLELAGGDGSQELLRQIDDLAKAKLAFSRATVLRDQLREAGRRLEDLVWRDIDLVAAESRWGEPVQPGDLMRVGERIVVLYEDRGEPGVLDYDDLCFDFVLGAAVRRLGDVFSGDGVVELTPLGNPS